MSAEKYENVYKLLSEHHLLVNECVPDKLKCSKCRKILINAYQGPCGCKLCRSCVDELLERGCTFCPGATDECREIELSVFQVNFGINRKIFNLVVKCPNEMCSFESELINMNEHLRICPNKNLKCVFYSSGCYSENIAAGGMNKHLQMEGHSHMTMLMEIIDNMKNEIDRLKENDIRNRKEIKILKQDSAMKAERIETLEEEINLIKVELAQQIERAETKFECKINEKSEKIESINNDIKSIKEDKIDYLEREIGKTVVRINASLDEMRQEWRGALDTNEAVVKETIDKYQGGMDERMIAIDKWMEIRIIGAFAWPIDGIAGKRANKVNNLSEYFYGHKRPYKMALSIYANGDWGSVDGTGFTILFRVYDDERNKDLKWPLEADVTIKIVNKGTPGACRMITKYCKIQKPEWNSYQFSESFVFIYSDLANDSLLAGDCLIVECCVELR